MTKLIILLLVLSIESFAQSDYDKIRRRKFYSAQFDSTSLDILRLEKKHAIIYFKKSDINELIKDTTLRDMKNSIPTEVYADLENFIASNKQIRLTDWWYDYTDEERKRMFGSGDVSSPKIRTV